MSFFRIPFSLFRLRRAAERHGFRLVTVEAAMALSRLRPADPKALEEIGASLKLVAPLCAEVQRERDEVYRLRAELASARVREWWLIEGHRDQRLGAMALAPTTENP